MENIVFITKEDKMNQESQDQLLANFNALVEQGNISRIRETVLEYVTRYGIKILICLLVLVVGLKLIKYVVKLLNRVLEKSHIDGSVNSFLLSLTNILLKILLFVFTANILGAPVASFVAILGTAGLAVGLALQGSLSNFAGGVLILILKPFSVGDYIKEDAKGNEGTVESIDIFYTTLKTRDNKVVVIPNGILSNNSIMNFSKKETRRIDITVGVGYKEDIYKVKRILKDLLDRHPLILQDPESSVNLVELGECSVDFLILAWAKSEDFWAVKCEVMEQIKQRLDEEGVNIPYPQMDVHVIQ
jgi:small conductance mechanosensitive channel